MTLDHSGCNHIVFVEEKGFWFFRHWKVWDTHNPFDVRTCWSKIEAGELVRTFASDDGAIAVINNDTITFH